MVININEDFIVGRKTSIRECEVGDIYCIESAIMGFIDLLHFLNMQGQDILGQI